MPFLLALGGILLDYVTTTLGLSMGFAEAYLRYNPLWAFLYFEGALAILVVGLPRKKPWTYCITGFALTTYLAPFNNLLVILGLFAGLPLPRI